MPGYKKPATTKPTMGSMPKAVKARNIVSPSFRASIEPVSLGTGSESSSVIMRSTKKSCTHKQVR